MLQATRTFADAASDAAAMDASDNAADQAQTITDSSAGDVWEAGSSGSSGGLAPTGIWESAFTANYGAPSPNSSSVGTSALTALTAAIGAFATSSPTPYPGYPTSMNQSINPLTGQPCPAGQVFNPQIGTCYPYTGVGTTGVYPTTGLLPTYAAPVATNYLPYILGAAGIGLLIVMMNRKK